MRGFDNDVTQRRKDARGTVWMLSKLTTHGVGTRSSLGVSSSSDTRPRCVLVRAATTTEPTRSATGSRVSTSTGRSPPGVAANQISPRCIAPITPILGRPPLGDLLQRALGISKRHLAPSLGVVLATQAHQVPMKSIAEDLRALHPERFRPALNLCSFGIRDTKTKHRHTQKDIMYDDAYVTAYVLRPQRRLESDAASDYHGCMAERRTTIVARDEDLALLQREARDRGLPLGRMLGEVVARRADELRRDRRPRLGTFSSEQSIAEAAARDNPAARPFRTA
jgi:hypothetical protein